jgi:hypothetical protein
MTFDTQPFTQDDDDFHPMPGDLWGTETAWFSFNVPERSMAGWLYAWIRPNLGNCGGGAFIYDPTGIAPWELPYFQYQYCQPLPDGPLDLRDMQFPQGYSVKMLEPLKRYRLHYEDRKTASIDLEFDAITGPHAFAHGKPPFLDAGHFDQPGKVTGTIVLRGETIPVDCYALRDRSWGTRMDHRGSRVGYPFGVASAAEGFCLFANPLELDQEGREHISHGFLLSRGVRRQLSSGTRSVERDPATGHILRQRIDAIDVDGRQLLAEGVGRSRMMLAVPRGVTMNTYMEWNINGQRGHGEDQDVWRYDQWLAEHHRRLAARRN